MNVALPEIDQPVRLRFERPMTDEELMRFCAANEMVRVERDANGELILMSPAGGGAASRNSEITYQLVKWARETNSGNTFDSSAGFRLPDGSMRSPDAAWIAWPRWNALSEKHKEEFPPICPEFVIELRSPSDRLPELQAKMRLWIANGAEVAWLVDPSRKAVEVYRPGREAEVVEGGSAVEGDGPIAGFVLELGRVWA
jgi:Uma2 family endonuclease